MQASELTVSNAISAGWQKTKTNYGVLIGALAVLVGISIGFGILDALINLPSYFVDQSNTGLLVVLALVSAILGLIANIGNFALQNLTSIGMTRISLSVLDGKPVSVGQLFKAEGVYWRYLGTSILYGLIVIGGILLLIVPGIIWAIKYQFALTLIVDKKLGVTESIKKSGEITQGNKAWLFGFGIVVLLINLAGLLALGLGLLLTIPLTLMAHIWVYRNLAGASTSNAPQPVQAQVAK